ncbi:family transcriptional regulator : Transcriptional regulators-like protein OS=Pirellula staleyi (strain ATCC 27377 / DSM 6068 / ICPB 4128) GN=Psta_4678 PE=4 SV=1: GntR: Peripla_BP_3 [Gemmata massiliana]|uniref:HTH gntR-type domain-containing protein n=1 Tax=Gemmata massiliana TaxID=1210884 RepID=A0A6P2DFY4_9BACT|nr:GntR family transcriptional regulator [Gemmata massiliana]VTR99787.1 family transcriptional regulator : Transcriptional regulators-like protein OS=Pirellula staleyi (strain ATCC 27377 / DSM 6068 / ICPB 4128) GN=Psta_4678 PE=4 SV=1: GntR: Peripla_BP_3 [Gemmata massiliana]
MSRSETPPDDSSPKYVHLAEQLAARLQAGEWGLGKVPTVRDIAGTYDVSSFTASRALQLLRDRGLVVTRDRSGSYVANERSAPAPVTPAGRWAVVTRVSPGPWQSASEAVVKVGFERVATEGSFAVHPLELSPGSGRVEAELIAGRIADNGAKGVFFLPSRVSEEACRQDEWFLAGCRRVGLPVVLLDRNLRGVDRPLEYDLVASDHFDGGLRCTEHLLGLGRKNVACVIASPTSTHTDRLAGYLSALQKVGDGYSPRVVRVPEHLDAREAYPWIADELVRIGVDGVICYQDYVAVGVMLELFRRGLNVPRDVAVVGCDDLPIGQSFALGVSSYSYPSEAIARTALRVIANRIAHPNDPLAKVMLAGRLVVRDSTVTG